MKQNFKIESNIPIPERTVKWTEFPLNEMKIGDSFFVPKSKYKKNKPL